MSATTTPPTLPLVHVNGRRIAPGAAAISSRDRGFTLADGLFETMRVRRGMVFRLDRHLARLSSGLRSLSIPEPAELRQWIAEALEAGADAGRHENGGHHTEMSMRLTVTRGPGGAGLAVPAVVEPTVVIALNPMPAFAAEIYARGLRVHVASGRRNPYAMSAGLKTLAYTDAVAAFLEAQREGADEALFLDTDGHCSEATASNLFICRAGMLLTPPVQCAALPGITRATVLELAGSMNLAARQEPFGLDALLGADEAFLTSSLRGIAPLVNVDGRPIGSGVPGPTTARFSAAYRASIDEECGAA